MAKAIVIKLTKKDGTILEIESMRSSEDGLIICDILNISPPEYINPFEIALAEPAIVNV